LLSPYQNLVVKLVNDGGMPAPGLLFSHRWLLRGLLPAVGGERWFGRERRLPAMEGEISAFGSSKLSGVCIVFARIGNYPTGWSGWLATQFPTKRPALFVSFPKTLFLPGTKNLIP
jgi:hypothetical protein